VSLCDRRTPLEAGARRQELDGETLPSFSPACPQHIATSDGAHARPKAQCSFSWKTFRLVRALGHETSHR